MAEHYDGWDEAPSFFQDSRFETYIKQISELIAKHGEVTTRMIHESLGRELQKYTLDALERLDIAQSYGVPTRFSLQVRRVKDLRHNYYDSKANKPYGR